MNCITFICLIICLLFVAANQITYNAQSSTILPKKIFAGEIHFARIPVEYWQHRILMIKALGLNAMSVYVMWNYHQVSKGNFDYSTENKNLPLFLQLAQKHNMGILLRPGPYVCAEWDFGGLPVRLYGNKNLKIRDNNQQFLNQVRIYFASLAPMIKAHLKTDTNPKGSIILLQIQNQYGSYGSDINYINALRKIWDDLGVVCQQYHQDGPKLITNSHWKGANIGLSGGTSQTDYSYARSIQKTGLIFGGQIYTGWLTHWGQKWQKGSTQSKVRDFGFLLNSSYSFSMYMVHGGTNFALTAGANSYNDVMDYKADVTSYDYDSPINEQGAATPKYHALKQLISKYVDWSIPNQPAQIKRIQIPRFKISPVASMLLNLGSPAVLSSQKYYHFESDELRMYNQGFVVYETKLTKRQYFFQGTIRDFAIVLLDDVFVVALDRSVRKNHNFTIKCEKQLCYMKIIVEAMGHINYGHAMETDIKGLFNLTDDLGVAFTWNIYKTQIDNSLLRWGDFNSKLLMSPTLLKSVILLQTVGDTYLDTSELTKGCIFVNGRNLGRYWNKGPQARLFCPGVWLKQGPNTIHVLQLLYDGKQKGITGKLILDDSLASHIM